MLSLDNAVYDYPRLGKSEGGSTVWVVSDLKGKEKRIASELHFTLLPGSVVLGQRVEEKLTFHYESEGTIRAAGRCFRIYGADYLRPTISRLMNIARGTKPPIPSEKRKKEARVMKSESDRIDDIFSGMN